MGAAEPQIGPPLTAEARRVRRAVMEQVFNDLTPRIEQCARRYLRHGLLKEGDDARDVSQEILAALWVRWENDIESFETPAHPQAYAERLVRNQVVDRTEKFRRRREVESDERTIEELDDLEHAGPTDPHADAVVRELESIIDERLGGLPTKRREACRLWWSGMGYAAIAQRLGISQSTARSHVHNGNRIICESLAPYIEEGR